MKTMPLTRLKRLASGAPIVDDTGAVIAEPTRDELLAQAHASGTEWRTEALGHNPYATVPVDKIGVYFVDGQAVDYTVEVTDKDGTFHMWARYLDMALEAQSEAGTRCKVHVNRHVSATQLHGGMHVSARAFARSDTRGISGPLGNLTQFRRNSTKGTTQLRQAA